MKTLKKIAGSRTVWTLVLLVASNIIGAYSGALKPEEITLLNSLLGALAVYFKISPSTKY